MKIDEQAAAVDTDFLCHICEMKKGRPQAFDLISTFFRDLEVQPIVHPLVYEKEIPKNDILIATLFEREIVWQPTFEDILWADTAKASYYSFLVEELYFKLSGERLKELPVHDVFVDWVRNKSLGEIHSVSMCLICKCGIFLSDDGDSKKLQRIIETGMLASITVYNRAEACKRLMDSGGTQLKRDELRALSHKR